MAKWILEHPPIWVPKLRKQVMLHMAILSHCRNTSRKVMVYHSLIVVVNASHLQIKVKINMEGIMVMFLPILFFIIKNIIMYFLSFTQALCFQVLEETIFVQEFYVVQEGNTT
jgi:hypothetical protein